MIVYITHAAFFETTGEEDIFIIGEIFVIFKLYFITYSLGTTSKNCESTTILT